MANYFGYMRISTESQEISSQKLGLLEYANSHGFAPMTLIEEVVTRTVDWRSRKLGEMLSRTERGDVICTPEFTRIAASPGQVFSFLEEATKRGVIIHITKSAVIMDGSVLSQILASCFSIASMIELDFIRARTKEGVRRAQLAGKKLGRPKGSTGKSKLDDRGDIVSGYVQIGLPKRRMAKVLGVSYNTVDRYLRRHHAGIEGHPPKA